jgi:hypothetical protein
MVSFQLVLGAAAQRLSNGYGGDSANNAVNPAQDIPYTQVCLQASGADAFLGADNLTTSTLWGAKVVATDLQPVILTGSVKLSDIWVAGAGSTIHVFGLPL